MLGSLHRVENTWNHRDSAKQMLAASLPTFQNIANFNDDPKTTKADVLKVFDKAIQLAKEASK